MSSSLPPPSKPASIVDNIDWKEGPTYGQFFSDSYQFFYESIYAVKNDSFINNFVKDFKLCYDRITIQDLSLIVILTIVWTLGRFWTTKAIFKPIASYFQIPKSDSEKMPESAWKFLFYLSTWSSMAYIILTKKCCPYFENPTLVWQNYSIDNAVETDIYVIYLVQLSFYVHSLYSTLRIDQWRKDSPTLMLHHVLCVLLISISLTTKSHRSGLLAMFLHDGCDILLEGTKLTRYFKVQGGKSVKYIDPVTNVGFGCFIAAWFFSRLYWFPLRQVYVASVYVKQLNLYVPFHLPLVAMLWVLLIMNVYWFTFILRLLYKVVTGQMKELEDNREYSSEQASLKAKSDDDLNAADDNKGTNARYYLRQRKMDYNLLHTGRSQ